MLMVTEAGGRSILLVPTWSWCLSQECTVGLGASERSRGRGDVVSAVGSEFSMS